MQRLMMLIRRRSRRAAMARHHDNNNKEAATTMSFRFLGSALVVLVWTTILPLCTTPTHAFFLGELLNRNVYASEPTNEWILVGGLNETSAWFHVYQEEFVPTAQLVVTTTEDPLLAQGRVYESGPLAETNAYGVHPLHVTGLNPNTVYHYGMVDTTAGAPQVRLPGRFRTPTPPGTPWNFTVALAGCARTGSQRAIFDVIRREEQPDLFLHLGDIHYENIECNCLEDRLDAVHTVLASRPQAELYRSTSLVYMWDDHDWLDNNSNGEEEEKGSRDAALRSYQILFPQHNLAAASDNNNNNNNTATIPTPTYHAFTVGTVRFIVSDLRSEGNATNIYSDAQRAWLEGELSQAANYDFVIWMSTKPYIGEAEEGDDAWFGYPEDRRKVSDVISHTIGAVDGGPQNLLAVASDAHMVAFDSGTNTYYGTEEQPPGSPVLSFPILQSGPLDQGGSTKGGPFTEGCFGSGTYRNHQYSTIQFEIPAKDDAGREACMNLNSYRVDDLDASRQLIFGKRLCGKIFSPSRAGVREGTCQLDSSLSFRGVYVAMVTGFLGTVAAVSTFFGSCW